MHDSQEARQHSTRTRPYWRLLSTLALCGVLLGLMLGRLQHEPGGRPQLLAVDAAEDELRLLFDRSPRLRAETLHGALVVHIEADGPQPMKGRLPHAGQAVAWSLVAGEQGGIRLSLVAAAALQGRLEGGPVDDGWRVLLRLQDKEKGDCGLPGTEVP